MSGERGQSMATRHCLAAMLLACAAHAHAQGYPNQPVKLIVPWPAGVPPEVVNRINAEVNAILRTPETRTRLANFGGEAGGGTPDDFTRFIGSEIARYADIVKASGAKVE